jgi:hypothetical protein
MNAIGAQLSTDDMVNLAAYFGSLSGVQGQAKSDMLPALVATKVSFPEGYKTSFVRYHTINFPVTKQVRHYYANEAAIRAAKEGKNVPDGAYMLAEVYSAKLDADKKPMVGPDGFFVADQLTGYTAMARDAGWGAEVPDLLRNENWNYAAFSAAKQLRTGVNQAECLACHKPLDKTSYLFTLEPLAAVAKAR